MKASRASGVRMGRCHIFNYGIEILACNFLQVEQLWIMPKRSSKDINETAFAVVRSATAEVRPASAQVQPAYTKNPAAVALGRLGGLKGGKARAANLSAKKRKEIAKKAAISRWGKRPETIKP